MLQESLRLRFYHEVESQRSEAGGGEQAGGGGGGGGWWETVLLVCPSLRASLMHSQAGPRGSKFALRSKLAEQTHGAAGDPSVSLLLLAASSDGGGLS